jgi:hypothetical protein
VRGGAERASWSDLEAFVGGPAGQATPEEGEADDGGAADGLEGFADGLRGAGRAILLVS